MFMYPGSGEFMNGVQDVLCIVLTGHSFQHPFVSAAPPNSKKAKCSEGNCVLGFFLVVY